MTTLHIVSSGGLYGVENMLLNLLPELEAQGEPVSLLCLDGEQAPLTVAARAQGIRTASVDCARPITPLGWLALFRHIASRRPARVHVHGYKATILAGSLALALRRRVVVTYHGLAKRGYELAPGLKKYAAAERVILRRAEMVVAVSQEIRDELVENGVPAARTAVVPNGITAPPAPAPEAPRPLQAGGPRLVAVGRLVPEKDFEGLLYALPALRASFPEIELQIAGDGPLHADLVDVAARLGVADCVRFLGFVSDVRSLLATADCFVMPSVTEGMPMALLEAMALACPIVASEVGGIPSMVRHGTEALLVPPGDKGELVRAVSSVLASEAHRQRLGAAARRRFDAEFTAKATAEAYRRLYRGAPE